MILYLLVMLCLQPLGISLGSPLQGICMPSPCTSAPAGQSRW